MRVSEKKWRNVTVYLRFFRTGAIDFPAFTSLGSRPMRVCGEIISAVSSFKCTLTPTVT